MQFFDFIVKRFDLYIFSELTCWYPRWLLFYQRSQWLLYWTVYRQPDSWLTRRDLVDEQLHQSSLVTVYTYTYIHRYVQ